MNSSTIAAIATPAGKGGIGIIKISGPESLSIAAAVFRASVPHPRSTGRGRELFRSHRIYHGHIVDPDCGRVVDEVLLSVMRSPRSYTREDVVEINAHSGYRVLSAILELVVSKGARLAEPGEFTKRAFLSGRIDLTRAEGVIDIINARSDRALQMAGEQIRGALSETIIEIRSKLISVIADIEAAIDFPEDVEQPVSSENARVAIEKEIRAPLLALIDQYRSGHFFRDGVTLAVVGRPNVGKSSLVNRLIQKDRIIVSAIPGTTRDLVEETFDIHGLPIRITDTAGLHDTEDPVEVMGIEKTRACMKDADLIYFLVDAGAPLTDDDEVIYQCLEGKAAILILNKIDLLADHGDFKIPKRWTIPVVRTSALYNRGIETLKALSAEIMMRNGTGTGQNPVAPNLRHKISLQRGVQAVDAALKGLGEAIPEELIAIELKQAVGALDEITGNAVLPTVLDEIFSRFCIGK